MPTGVTRILPFALISAALHAAVLMSAPERLKIAVTPGGDTGPVAVRLVPSGPATPDPAAQSGVAGSTPKPSRSGDGQPEPTATTAAVPTPDETTAGSSGSSSGSSEPESTEPDRVQAASAERDTTEATPADTDQPRADAAATDRKEQPDESGTTSDSTPESTETAEAGTSDTPASPAKPEPPETTGTPEHARAEDANATDAVTRTAESTDHATKPESSDSAENDEQADEQSGADGADDRAQLASHARQQVQIHFRDRFRYPRIARQRGWEGRVVLSFQLQPDGRITDVEVIESSGRSILDENARQTLIHIQRVPELADRMGRESLELEVPVTYRLQPA